MKPIYAELRSRLTINDLALRLEQELRLTWLGEGDVRIELSKAITRSPHLEINVYYPNDGSTIQATPREVWIFLSGDNETRVLLDWYDPIYFDERGLQSVPHFESLFNRWQSFGLIFDWEIKKMFF
jgi:hypothetical protein